MPKRVDTYVVHRDDDEELRRAPELVLAEEEAAALELVRVARHRRVARLRHLALLLVAHAADDGQDLDELRRHGQVDDEVPVREPHRLALLVVPPLHAPERRGPKVARRERGRGQRAVERGAVGRGQGRLLGVAAAEAARLVGHPGVRAQGALGDVLVLVVVALGALLLVGDVSVACCCLSCGCGRTRCTGGVGLGVSRVV